jgi:hypothetical protein
MELVLDCSSLILNMAGRLRKTAVPGKKYSQNGIYQTTRFFNLYGARAWSAILTYSDDRL